MQIHLIDFKNQYLHLEYSSDKYIVCLGIKVMEKCLNLNLIG